AADLHEADLPHEQVRSLAWCTSTRIPDDEIQQGSEKLTGRARVKHLSKSILDLLMPTNTHVFVTRYVDASVVLALSPIWLPLMLIIGVLIKLESDGPMFFVQDRVGKGNRPFRMYKLRSMRRDSEKDGARFASTGDARITRVGRYIRKTRLD